MKIKITSLSLQNLPEEMEQGAKNIGDPRCKLNDPRVRIVCKLPNTSKS